MAGILVVGFIFVDIKGFSAGHYVPAGRNVGSVRMIQGGVSRNVTENIANTKTPVTFVSLSDRDSALGSAAVERLARAGADTTHIRMVPSGGIGQWMVILDENGGVAGQISSPPDRAALEALVSDEGEALVRDADAVIVELDTSELIDQLILGWAKKYGKPVYTVVGNMSVIAAHPEFVSALDCFVCNEIEIGRLLGEALENVSPEVMLAVLRANMEKLGCPAAIVTMGEKGSVYCDTKTGEAGVCPIVPVRLVDSTGAGDAYLSGVVMGLLRGLPLSAAARAGANLASAAISTDESSIPSLPAFWEEFR